VLGPSAVVPLALLVAAPFSADLGVLAPVAILGWLFLVWFLRRTSATAWLAYRHDRKLG